MTGGKVLFGTVIGVLICLVMAACTSPGPSAASSPAPSPRSATPTAATRPPTPSAAPARTATSASPTSSGDAAGCGLLPMADVAKALGEPVVANNNFGCEFDSVRRQPFKMVRFIGASTTAATFESESRETAKENGGADSFAAVSGVGDAAFSWHDDQGSARLDLRKGNRKVEIWVDLGVLGTKDLATKQKIAAQLGTVAVARLGGS